MQRNCTTVAAGGAGDDMRALVAEVLHSCFGGVVAPGDRIERFVERLEAGQ